MTEKIDQDFATGKRVDSSKPEEAVRQDYERILHHDLGYPKSCIDINVAIQMGRQTKFSDIVVYDDAESRNIIGIVETKAPGEVDTAQLRELGLQSTKGGEPKGGNNDKNSRKTDAIFVRRHTKSCCDFGYNASR